MVIAPRAREASVQISLQFDRSRTVDSAAQDVRAAINATAGQLPPTKLRRRHG
jgi:multidrug efflux pump subunit AcrB